jgi:hypothetical protein
MFAIELGIRSEPQDGLPPDLGLEPIFGPSTPVKLHSWPYSVLTWQDCETGLAPDSNWWLFLLSFLCRQERSAYFVLFFVGKTSANLSF